jgi:ribonuclease HI
MTEPDVIAYTDGGCRGNPGVGGWGFVLINPRTGKALERCGGERETTNNRMELSGAIQALAALLKPGLAVRVFSDSQYVIKGMSEWVRGWQARGWRKADKEPVMNADGFVVVAWSARRAAPSPLRSASVRPCS